MMKQAHIAWSAGLFARLKDGGVWGIPACGLLFQRQGNSLVLIDRMPHDPAMPISADELRRQQDSMFADCEAHFTAAGVTVTSGARK